LSFIIPPWSSSFPLPPDFSEDGLVKDEKIINEEKDQDEGESKDIPLNKREQGISENCEKQEDVNKSKDPIKHF